MTTTVVIGGSFAGMTAALEIKRKGKNDHKSKSQNIKIGPSITSFST